MKKHRVAAERKKFNIRVQRKNEKVDDFITDLWKLSESCNYKDLREEMVRDRILAGILDEECSDHMALMDDLNIETAIQMARQAETQREDKAVLRLIQHYSSITSIWILSILYDVDTNQ